MDFLDRTLLRLTDAAERSAILTPAVGNRLLEASFVFNNVAVGPVTGVSVRDIDILPAVSEQQEFEGAFMHPASGMRWEGTANIAALVPHAAADARMEVMLTTETRIADTSIRSVETKSLEDLASLPAIDARIVADDGALPGNADALATRRFTALKTLLHERFTQPADFDVDNFFEAKGINTVDELLEYLDPSDYPHRIELEMVTDGTLPSRIANHRVIAAVQIEENPVARLHAVIDEIQTGRALMGRATETASAPNGMSKRTDLPYVLIFDAASLEDADLPFPTGSNPATPAARRNARLSELQTRLRPFGIALAPISN